MTQKPKYYIVEAAALPEAFQKVAEVKRILSSGGKGKVNRITQEVGISRSAYYKYKDSIFPFENLMAGRIITFQINLRDEAGLLSQLLQIFADAGANILTINQTIPVGGFALLTISAETIDLSCPVEVLLRQIEQHAGVSRAEILAG
ncbi:MAG: ACT domain-containing protein [Oscillospiraceae bacterium]|nr:ACT domain-containing protein [Oscillospiraceae bacterium]MBR2081204.1 ACT domain-containing protein [Oscillospiraceae bacterium]MBR2366028.1 ACT domain-containing protein [Oscillospiraceae bacterium]MBR2976739.1 ACT domain-containing protein [Oscillospiraceae bacterium]MBR3849729.1 ACT domain-containing protein [Oscillospiraceae bacterium]